MKKDNLSAVDCPDCAGMWDWRSASWKHTPACPHGEYVKELKQGKKKVVVAVLSVIGVWLVFLAWLVYISR